MAITDAEPPPVVQDRRSRRRRCRAPASATQARCIPLAATSGRERSSDLASQGVWSRPDSCCSAALARWMTDVVAAYRFGRATDTRPSAMPMRISRSSKSGAGPSGARAPAKGWCVVQRSGLVDGWSLTPRRLSLSFRFRYARLVIVEKSSIGQPRFKVRCGTVGGHARQEMHAAYS